MSADVELKTALKNMIVERLFLSVDPATVPDDANLMEAYGLDSVNLFEIVVGLEDELGLVLEEGDFSLEAFATVETIADLVERKREA